MHCNENQLMLRLEINMLLGSFLINFDEMVQVVFIMFVSITKILQSCLYSNLKIHPIL